VAGITSRNGWVTCSYEHEWISAGAVAQPADTLREIEVVLYRTAPPPPGPQPHPGSAQEFTAARQHIYEPEFLRSVTPLVTGVEGGGLLLAVQECVNGTGGCEQSFLVNRGGGWGRVKLTFLDSVERRYPGAVHRTFRVNPQTLRAEVWLYSKTDPNCCPSRSALASLRLRGNALEAKTIRLKR